MKSLITILIAFFAYSGLSAQCNLSVTNNTGVTLDITAAEADAYDCISFVNSGGTPTTSVGSGGTISIAHVNPSLIYWIGIDVSGQGYPNDLAPNCISGSGSYTVNWVNACTVTIN
ncbi:MAG: hypothetical protein RJQ00_13190 [Vicingaceae bacterium]